VWRHSRSDGKCHLYGAIFNHPGFPDGTRITTSYLIARYGHLVLTSRGSHYLVGMPNQSILDPTTPVSLQVDKGLKKLGIIEYQTFDAFRLLVEQVRRKSSPRSQRSQLPSARLHVASGKTSQPGEATMIPVVTRQLAGMMPPT